MSDYNTLIYNAKQIVQVVANGERYVRGGSELSRNLAIQEDSQANGRGQLCLVAINGKIEFIGFEKEERFEKCFKHIDFTERIDATGCCILPGFIDSHTHPVWAGDRLNEFKMKLAGATYMQIHEAGGGIHFTVKHTRNASEEELYQSLKQRLLTFTEAGTTFAECKSGYGLELETELKMLRVLTRAKRELASVIGISNTYLGAHAVPQGKTAQDATDDILNNHLPKLKELIDAQEIDVNNIDVFCEKGVFDVEQSRAILEKGKYLTGLNINFHGDELFPLNSVDMGVRLNAKGISHLEEISDEEISLMSQSETVGILLPTTAYIMRLKRPPARKMLDSGCIVALGSDFNPNAYCYSMPLVMNLACVEMRMTMNEALIASTINSAFCLGVESSKGSIEVGKSADLILVKADKWENIIYQLGCHHRLIKNVFVNGKVV